MHRRHITAAAIIVALLVATVAFTVVYRVRAQGEGSTVPQPAFVPPAPPTTPHVIYRLNSQGTPVPTVVPPATFPNQNEPLPPASSGQGKIQCGQRYHEAHWQGRVYVIGGPIGTPVPCATPEASPQASPAS